MKENICLNKEQYGTDRTTFHIDNKIENGNEECVKETTTRPYNRQQKKVTNDLFIYTKKKVKHPHVFLK